MTVITFSLSAQKAFNISEAEIFVAMIAVSCLSFLNKMVQFAPIP